MVVSGSSLLAPVPATDAFRLVLSLTFRCNLRCPYCYVKLRTQDTMSLADALQSVDLGLGSLRPGGHLGLCFFGGEPLLMLEMMREVTLAARERAQVQQKFVLPKVTTNGTLLTREAAQELRALGFEVTVSVDGVQVAHDRNRMFVGGGGSHAIVKEGLSRALEAGLVVRTNLVVTPATVSWLAAGVEELIALSVEQVDVSPDYDAQWGEADLAQLDRQYEAIGDLYLRQARAGHALSVSFIDSKLEAAYQNGKTDPHCSFGVREIAVDPRGRIFPCERLIRDDDAEELVIGRLPTGVDSARLQRLLNLNKKLPEDCASCGLLDVCTRFCSCVNFSRTGSVWEPDGLVCFIEDLSVRVTERVIRSALKSNPPALTKGNTV